MTHKDMFKGTTYDSLNKTGRWESLLKDEDSTC